MTVTHFGLLSRTATTHCISHAERNKTIFNMLQRPKSLRLCYNTHAPTHTRKHQQQNVCVCHSCLSSKLNSPASGCLPSLPCRHCVKLANSAPGASRSKSQLGDWLPQKHIGSRKNCIALLQTLGQSELNSPEEWAGLPSLSIGMISSGSRTNNIGRRIAITYK